jgi:hypothetical protein
MSSNQSNETICNKCNTEYNKGNDECTPDKCGLFEQCDNCGGDINCSKANLHILINNSNTLLPTFTWCRECCENRTEEQLTNGWMCDECDYNLSDDDSTDDEPQDDEQQDYEPQDG